MRQLNKKTCGLKKTLATEKQNTNSIPGTQDVIYVYEYTPRDAFQEINPKPSQRTAKLKANVVADEYSITLGHSYELVKIIVNQFCFKPHV